MSNFFPDAYYEAVAYENDEEYEGDGESIVHTLEDFYDLIRWDDGGILLLIDCAHVEAGIARYAFVVDMDYNFSDNGFLFVMNQEQMIGLEDGNDPSRIENESFLIGSQALAQAVFKWERSK